MKWKLWFGRNFISFTPAFILILVAHDIVLWVKFSVYKSIGDNYCRMYLLNANGWGLVVARQGPALS